MNTQSIYSKIVDFLFPVTCVSCNTSGVILCENCVTTCAPTNTYTLPKNTIAIFSYKDRIIRHIIKKMKYNNRHVYAESFGKILDELIIEELADRLVQTNTYILCPIPLSNKKRRVHNHAEKIAEAISHQNTSTTIKKLLVKKIKTKQQAHIKNKNLRIANMHGVFDVTHATISPTTPIIVVDDVITTGATMNEAMRVLKKHYGKHRIIIGVAIAH